MKKIKSSGKVGGSAKFGKKQTMKANFKSGLKLQFLEEKQIQVAKDKEALALKRVEELARIKAESEDGMKSIVLPSYEWDDRLKIMREVKKPPPTVYTELGFNDEYTDGRKHYRRFYDDELENDKDIFKKPTFHTFDIQRGQSRGNKKGFFSMFSAPETDDSGQISTIKTVGKFKGRINIFNETDYENYKMTKEGRMQVIIDLLSQIHMNKFGSPLELDSE